MAVPEFISYYRYTVGQALEEYAVTFFSMLNAMSRIKADESLKLIAIINSSMSDERSYINYLEKESKGKHGLLKEVNIAKKFRGRK